MSTVEDLRATADAVAAHVAAAYRRLAPPFYEEEVGRFAHLPGVHPDLAQRFVKLYSTQVDEHGDCGKATVLIACALVRAALQHLPTEGRANLSTAIDLACSKPAEQVQRIACRLESVEDVMRVATTAAGGNVALGNAMTQALSEAGSEGALTVSIAPPDSEPGCYTEAGEEISAKGIRVTIFVRGATESEDAELFARGCNTMHAATAAIPYGAVPGGGVAYFLAAEALRDLCDTDTITGLAATAVCAALEAPLRVRASAQFDRVRAALEGDPEQAYHDERGLVPVDDGPLDAARIVQRAISEAGRAAGELLRKVL